MMGQVLKCAANALGIIGCVLMVPGLLILAAADWIDEAVAERRSAREYGDDDV